MSTEPAAVLDSSSPGWLSPSRCCLSSALLRQSSRRLRLSWCTSLFSCLCLWSCPKPCLQSAHLSISFHGCSAGPPWVTWCDPLQAFHCPQSPLPSSPAGSRPPRGGLASRPCRHAPVPEAGGTGVSSGPFLCSLCFRIMTWRFRSPPASVREGGSCCCRSRAPCTEWPETTQI